MGHSFLKFKGKGLRFNDTWSEMAIVYLTKEIDKHKFPDCWVQELNEWWSFSSTGATSSSMDLKLDDFLINQDRILCIVILIGNAINSLERKNGFISVKEYNSFIDPDIKNYAEEPVGTERVVKTLELLRDLILGKLKYTINDDLYYPGSPIFD